MTGLFLQWLYSDAPASFWDFRRRLSSALLSFFSVSLLSKTLFDPWRHDEVDTSRLPLKDRFQAIGNNLISRFIGLTLRLWVIGIGLFLVAGLAFATLVFVIAWYILPLLLLISIGYGVKLMVGL